MRRLLKFAFAGGLGFAVDAVALYSFVNFAHLNPFVARIPAFFIAVTLTWWVNRIWTFRHHAGNHLAREFFSYLSIQGAGALINFLIYSALVGLTKPPISHPVIALAVASVIAMVANYIGLNKWVYRTSGEPVTEAGVTRRQLLTVASLVACLFFGGFVSVQQGQDVNFDLKNYHIYGPWAVIEDRSHLDFFAAGIQTYFNPLLDFPHYGLMRAGLGEYPRLMAFIMGFPYGLLIFLTALVFFRSFSATGMPVRRAAIATAPALFLAATGSATVCQIGTVFNELQVACLIVASILVALPNRVGTSPGAIRLILAGCLCGIAAGLKLTACLYAPALMIALMASATGIREAIQRAAIGSMAWCVAFGLTYSWWGLRLYELTGSPVFPMFNRIFRSPWLGDASFLDNRFKPHGLWQTLFYPFDWMKTNQLVVEPPFRDMRFFLAEVFLLMIAGVIALRFLRRRTDNHDTPVLCSPAFRFLVAFLIVGYAIWLGLFSILRYAVPLELLTGLVIIIGPVLLLARKRTSVFIVGIAVITSASIAIHRHTRLPDFGHQPFGERILSIDAPKMPPDCLVVFIWPQGSYLAPTLAEGRRDIRFMSITGEALRARDLNYEMWRKMTTLIREHRGPTCVVLRKEYPGTEKVLPDLGLDIHNTVSCPLRSSIDSEMTIHFARSRSLSDEENRRNETITVNRFGAYLNRNLNHTNSALFSSGWSSAEPEIRWSDAPKSTITFSSVSTEATDILIEGQPLGEQTVSIALNGLPAFDGRIPDTGLIRLPLKGNRLKNSGTNTLEFIWHDARQPGNGDPRLLAFAFRRIILSTDNPPANP